MAKLEKDKQKEFVKALLAKKVERGEIWPKLAVKFGLSDSYARLCVYKWFPMGSKSHSKRSKMRKGFKVGWDKARKNMKAKKPAAKKATPAKTAKMPKMPKVAPKKAPAKPRPKGLLAKATQVNKEKPKSFLAQAQAEVVKAAKPAAPKVVKPKPAPVQKAPVAASSVVQTDSGIEYGRNGD